MLIVNPTDKDIDVQIEGVEYNLPAVGELKDVPAKHALYWKSKLHNFVLVKEDVKEVIKGVKNVIEEVKDVVEEVEDVKEAVEEVVADVKTVIKKVGYNKKK